jgi:hypothetical protein
MRFQIGRSSFRTRAALQAEILGFRYPLTVLRTNMPFRLRLKRSDHGLWVLCRDSGLAPMSADGPTLRYTPTGAVISVPNEPVETWTRFFGGHSNFRCP